MVDTNNRLVYNYYSIIVIITIIIKGMVTLEWVFFVKKQDVMPAEDRALFYYKVSSNSLN